MTKSLEQLGCNGVRGELVGVWKKMNCEFSMCCQLSPASDAAFRYVHEASMLHLIQTTIFYIFLIHFLR